MIQVRQYQYSREKLNFYRKFWVTDPKKIKFWTNMAEISEANMKFVTKIFK